ncbi:unnamed protein product, partial [Rotaria socialis]
MREKNYSVEISREIRILIDHLNSSNAAPRQRLPSDPVNPSCRTSLFPEYACDEMDELD